jgi:hypothetical protein
MSDREQRLLRSYEFTARMLRIMKKAASNAQLENWRFGLPNIYSFNHQLHYEMPDGRILTQEQYDLEIKK